MTSLESGSHFVSSTQELKKPEQLADHLLRSIVIPIATLVTDLGRLRDVESRLSLDSLLRSMGYQLIEGVEGFKTLEALINSQNN